MQTRRSLRNEPSSHHGKRKRGISHKQQQQQDASRRKKRCTNVGAACGVGYEQYCSGSVDLFDELPDDIVVSIICRVSETASRASDLLSLAITCKRLRVLVGNPLVLERASPKALAFAATVSRWSEPTHRFLRSCADAGNLEACYILGMIRFYCQRNRSGASLMARAAMGSHAAALYSLAVIQFNGSGGSKGDKDLRAGVALCARAAFLGHVDAMRELGHCLQDGYGVRQNVAEGRRFLVQANARELAAAAAVKGPRRTRAWRAHLVHHPEGAGCPLLSDFGCAVPPPEVHVANQFLIDWFVARKPAPTEEGLRMCSHAGCGRPESRRHEFRRCSVCGAVNYCSRACQALDWKLRHKAECVPAEQWRGMGGGDDVHDVVVHGADGGDGVAMEVEDI